MTIRCRQSLKSTDESLTTYVQAPPLEGTVQLSASGPDRRDILLKPKAAITDGSLTPHSVQRIEEGLANSTSALDAVDGVVQAV